MQNVPPVAPYSENLYFEVARPTESSHSAVSWSAVIAGAVIAAAISAMLVIGGSGLGFLSMSPWHNAGASASTLAVGSIVWLFVTQIIAYGLAGYVTGRLRTKWTGIHDDEIYFRDTAHGFLVWALSAVASVIVLGSAMTSVVSGTAKAGVTLAAGSAGAAAAFVGQSGQGIGGSVSLDYFTDALLRPNDPTAASNQTDIRPETSRVLARAVVTGEMSDADRSYLVKVIAQHAGIDENTASQRLDQVKGQARQAIEQAEQKTRAAADAARKAAAAFAVWAFASLLAGAFVASLCATIGGRTRDTLSSKY